MGLNLPPHLVPKVLEKSRAIPLLTLRACVAYKKREKPSYYQHTLRYTSEDRRAKLLTYLLTY